MCVWLRAGWVERKYSSLFLEFTAQAPINYDYY
jgi:hypothetical protein